MIKPGENPIDYYPPVDTLEVVSRYGAGRSGGRENGAPHGAIKPLIKMR